MSSVTQLLKQAQDEIVAADNQASLDKVRVKYLGKKGSLTSYLKELGSLPSDKRAEAGKAINDAKNSLMSEIKLRQSELQADSIASKLLLDKLDVSLPGRGQKPGRVHPITRTLQRITDIFTSAGFETRIGPEIEDDYYNFTALNIPENHPARAMHDTFYLESGELLRTHTSPVQIRAMQNEGAPIRLIAPGRVYRCDSDLTHTPMFTQIEGLAVGADISFANLKAVLYEFVSNFFEREIELRFRPAYFPFTEPSAEVDIRAESGEWLEILGCGMVHPNVLRNVDIDSEKFRGYAFGMGVDRLAMLRYGVDDLRLFFENDLPFLAQFS
ncbi:MAG: phenylalanine--tRNA ligase subunit alpha [Rhodospirillaceae bacterium]|nr:phenylalanine--tRNA ligase subunit alpha [Rhodospirillaceae bacterium]|tara:strand:+ start:6714 stop:7697 length:984 start_codon:yes stop_codon:yes gene_type:complete